MSASTISATQDAIIAHIAGLLAGKCRFVESHPGNWSEASVRTVVSSAPSVYVAWLGAKPGEWVNSVVNHWGVFVAAQTLNAKVGEPVGAYQMVEVILRGFGFEQVESIGKMTLTAAKNLWTDARSGNGCIIYALYFDNPSDIADYSLPLDAGDYLRHFQQFDTGHDGAPMTEAHITLAGPKESNDENTRI
ncbi:phage protein Gp37 [Citrobacter braakii]|uniref:phage protein Gp37 n=1 Tax=Citrobacter braakii TaxID=57706 RepID=UPI00403A4F97